MYGVYIVYRPTLLVFKSDRIVVGMVFGGGGGGTCEKGGDSEKGSKR